jgi:hypothetical protein
MRGTTGGACRNQLEEQMPKQNIEWGESEQPAEGGVIEERPRPAASKRRRRREGKKKSKA